MNFRQQRFAEEYLIDLNATQAAIRAGYSPKRADATGYNLLRKAEIQAAIHEGRQKIQNSTQVTVRRVVSELAISAFADPAELFTDTGELLSIHDMPEHVRRSISSIEIDSSGVATAKVSKVKLNDKLRALDCLMKHLGGYMEDNRQRGLAVAGTVAALMEAIDGRSTPLVQAHVGRIIDVTPQDRDTVR
jgi:phage terminase small subunit